MVEQISGIPVVVALLLKYGENWIEPDGYGYSRKIVLCEPMDGYLTGEAIFSFSATVTVEPDTCLMSFDHVGFMPVAGMGRCAMMRRDSRVDLYARNAPGDLHVNFTVPEHLGMVQMPELETITEPSALERAEPSA